MVTIEGASADDIGLYKCEASNNLVGPDGELLIDTVEIRIGVTGLLFESVFLKKTRISYFRPRSMFRSVPPTFGS